MILDRLANADQYVTLHPGFAAAFNFLRTADLASLPDGRNEIDGERLYAIVARVSGAGRRNARLEVHRRYIDIQFALTGTDDLGWKPTDTCTQPTQEFDVAGDCQQFADAPDAWIALPPGTFVIYFPGDAHAPLGSADNLRKVVLKIAVDW